MWWCWEKLHGFACGCAHQERVGCHRDHASVWGSVLRLEGNGDWSLQQWEVQKRRSGAEASQWKKLHGDSGCWWGAGPECSRSLHRVQGAGPLLCGLFPINTAWDCKGASSALKPRDVQGSTLHAKGVAGTDTQQCGHESHVFKLTLTGYFPNGCPCWYFRKQLSSSAPSPGNSASLRCCTCTSRPPALKSPYRPGMRLEGFSAQDTPDSDFRTRTLVPTTTLPEEGCQHRRRPDGSHRYNSGFTEWMETTQVNNQRSVFSKALGN